MHNPTQLKHWACSQYDFFAFQNEDDGTTKTDTRSKNQSLTTDKKTKVRQTQGL